MFAPLLFALPPVRWLVGKLVYAPGTGPTKEEHKADFAEWRAVGYPDSTSQQHAMAKMRYKGSAYEFTGMSLAEGAACILYDEEENTARKMGGGVLTPATLGQRYLDRLDRHGMNIEMSIVD